MDNQNELPIQKLITNLLQLFQIKKKQSITYSLLKLFENYYFGMNSDC